MPPVDPKSSQIDGKAFAAGISLKVERAVNLLKREIGITPGLAVVLVGNDAASEVYVRNKVRQAKQTGIASFEYRLDESVSADELLQLVHGLNNDTRVHAILIQLPLPAHIDAKSVMNAINPAKDVDGFHVANVGALSTGGETLAPCTPLGCLMLLRSIHGELSGLDAVIVGRSNIVGKPMAQLLLRDNCSVTIVHSRSKNIAATCRGADIVVAAVGSPELVKAHWVKPGATVIDVGINRVVCEDGKARLIGDVEFDSVAEIAGAITPVPGGVGPMTIACLLANCLNACRRLNGLMPIDELTV